MPYADPEKKRQYAKAHYGKHRHRYVRAARVWDAKNLPIVRAIIAEHKANNACVDCGESDPVVLEFDHVRGVKSFTIGTAAARRVSPKTIRAEIAKCEVRCANCHRRITHKRRGETRRSPMAHTHCSQAVQLCPPQPT